MLPVMRCRFCLLLLQHKSQHSNHHLAGHMFESFCINPCSTHGGMRATYVTLWGFPTEKVHLHCLDWTQVVLQLQTRVAMQWKVHGMTSRTQLTLLSVHAGRQSSERQRCMGMADMWWVILTGCCQLSALHPSSPSGGWSPSLHCTSQQTLQNRRGLLQANPLACSNHTPQCIALVLGTAGRECCCILARTLHCSALVQAPLAATLATCIVTPGQRHWDTATHCLRHSSIMPSERGAANIDYVISPVITTSMIVHLLRLRQKPARYTS